MFEAKNELLVIRACPSPDITLSVYTKHASRKKRHKYLVHVITPQQVILTLCDRGDHRVVLEQTWLQDDFNKMTTFITYCSSLYTSERWKVQ